MVAQKERKSNLVGGGNHEPPTTHRAGIRIANARRMAISEKQKRLLAVGAVGAGAVLAAQMWRRRDPYEFAGRSVVITGGSRGLGLVMARQLAAEGARLTIVARDEAELHRAVDDLQARQPFLELLVAQADIR